MPEKKRAAELVSRLSWCAFAEFACVREASKVVPRLTEIFFGGCFLIKYIANQKSVKLDDAVGILSRHKEGERRCRRQGCVRTYV